jgi:hypothetical protein
MDVVKSGRRNTLSPDIETVCAVIANLNAGWERHATSALLSYDEARQIEPKADVWMLLAENAALRAHTLICEDGPVLPKEVLEGMYAQGFMPIEESILML